MKLAIKKIEYIQCSKVYNWGHVGRNDSLKVSNFIDGPYSELKFTDLTPSLEEEWIQSASGVYSQVQLTGTIRANKDQMRSILASMIMTKNIYRVTAMDGTRYVIGSLDFKPKMLFKLVVEQMTASEYQFAINCKSTHGLVYDIS